MITFSSTCMFVLLIHMKCFFTDLPLNQIPFFRSKALNAEVLQFIKVHNMKVVGDLLKLEKGMLVEQLGAHVGPKLYNMCRGMDVDPVVNSGIIFECFNLSMSCHRNLKFKRVLI